jgi:Domain of unknown function (DUF4124)
MMSKIKLHPGIWPAIWPAALLASALILPQPAWAIYQCVVNGHTTYQDKPCPPGNSSKQIAEAAPVSAAEVARAKKQATQEKQRLAKQEADQEKQARLDSKLANKEAKQRASTERKCKDLAMKQKWASEDAAQARIQGSSKSQGKAQTRAQRAAEKYQSECGAT